MLRVPIGATPLICEASSHLDQLVGIESEAKIKMAATDTENNVVTTANSMLNSCYRLRTCALRWLRGIGELISHRVEGRLDLRREPRHGCDSAQADQACHNRIFDKVLT